MIRKSYDKEKKKGGNSFKGSPTFLDTRNSIALATWKAALTSSVKLICLSGSSVGGNHVGS